VKFSLKPRWDVQYLLTDFLIFLYIAWAWSECRPCNCSNYYSVICCTAGWQVCKTVTISDKYRLLWRKDMVLFMCLTSMFIYVTCRSTTSMFYNIYVLRSTLNTDVKRGSILAVKKLFPSSSPVLPIISISLLLTFTSCAS